MKIGQYNIKERRTLIITNDYKKLAVEVSIDFIITEEWLNSQMTDPIMSKCINWLIKKGFIFENGKWNIYKKNENIQIRLPQYFINDETESLLVSFGHCEVITFHVPRPIRGYCSLKEFPTYLPGKCYIDINNKYYNDVVFKYINYYSIDIYKKFIDSKGKMKDINAEYYKDLLDPNQINVSNGYQMNIEGCVSEKLIEYNEKKFMKRVDFCNFYKSNKAITKFNL